MKTSHFAPKGALFSLLALPSLWAFAVGGCGKAATSEVSPESTRAAAATPPAAAPQVATPPAAMPPAASPGAASAGDTEKMGGREVVALSPGGETRVFEPGRTTLAETDTYIVTLEAAPAAAGAGAEAAKVSLHVKPKPGWKLNQEFPTRLRISGPEGVAVQKPDQRSADATLFTEKEATFSADFRAPSPGSAEFSASFRFAVCTESTCDPKQEDLRWAVTVK